MYKDSTLIMQLLRDNLTLCTLDMQDSGKFCCMIRSDLDPDFSAADKPADKDEPVDAPADESMCLVISFSLFFFFIVSSSSA